MSPSADVLGAGLLARLRLSLITVCSAAWRNTARSRRQRKFIRASRPSKGFRTQLRDAYGTWKVWGWVDDSMGCCRIGGCEEKSVPLLLLLQTELFCWTVWKLEVGWISSESSENQFFSVQSTGILCYWHTQSTW